MSELTIKLSQNAKNTLQELQERELWDSTLQDGVDE
jgi:hypothetical protein